MVDESGLQIVYDARLTEGLQSRRVAGRYTPEGALRELLADTDLDYRVRERGTVILERAAQASPPPEPLAQATPPPEPEEEVVTLPEITVTASPLDDTGYSVFNATTATKTDTPIMETPVSIQVIPREVMDDQKATTFRGALENVSSVRPQTTIGRGTGILIRGFRDQKTYRNGLLANRGDFSSEYDAANLQSVEVLKGPAAVLFGRIEPGGLINLVTKRPLDTRYYSLELQFGSYDFYRTQWDATGPITDDESLLYRFTGSYQDSNSFRDFHFTDRFLVNPSVTWRPFEATEITLEAEGFNQDYQTDRGLLAIGNRPAPIPISRSFIEPNDPVDNISRALVGFNLTHAFNESWTLRNRFLASFVHTDDFSIKPANFQVQAAFLDPRAGNRIYQRNFVLFNSDSENYATNLDLVGKFELWQTKHETLIGFDYLNSTAEFFSKGNFRDPVPGVEIDIFNPTFGIDPAFYEMALLTNFPPGGNFAVFKDEWFGVYFQDHITLWDRVHVLGGGRYDWSEVATGRGGSFDEASDNIDNAVPSGIRKDEEFSPRVGVLYQPWNWFSVYGNWTTSFGANNGITAAGQPLPPESGEQYEAGVKTELFDQQLSATLAYYHLTKLNILTPDFTTPDPNDSAAIGKARSQGIEVDAIGRITESLSVVGNYAYTDARIIKDNRVNFVRPGGGYEGNRLSNVPEHSGSLWLKYDVHGIDALDGLSFGLGVFAVGQRNGDDENTFKLPGFARLDASAAYRWNVGSSRVTAQLNIRNLLDKEYFESTDPFTNALPRVSIYPGAPLTFVGSLRVEY